MIRVDKPPADTDSQMWDLPAHVVSDRGPQSPEKRALVPGVNELLWGSMNLDSHNTTNFY